MFFSWEGQLSFSGEKAIPKSVSISHSTLEPGSQVSDQSCQGQLPAGISLWWQNECR